MATKKTTEQAPKTERPYLRIEVITKEAVEAGVVDGKSGVILTVGRIFRNRANAREAAAAWSQKNTIQMGVLAITEATSEAARKRAVVETRKPGEAYGAADPEFAERARQAEMARVGGGVEEEDSAE